MDDNMRNDITRIVYVLNGTNGAVELRVLADAIEQKNGWVLAVWRNQVVGGVKEEHLKAFYLEAFGVQLIKVKN